MNYTLLSFYNAANKLSKHIGPSLFKVTSLSINYNYFILIILQTSKYLKITTF
jgi:sialic acid synthase SpsE